MRISNWEVVYSSPTETFDHSFLKTHPQSSSVCWVRVLRSLEHLVRGYCSFSLFWNSDPSSLEAGCSIRGEVKFCGPCSGFFGGEWFLILLKSAHTRCDFVDPKRSVSQRRWNGWSGRNMLNGLFVLQCSFWFRRVQHANLDGLDIHDRSPLWDGPIMVRSSFYVLLAQVAKGSICISSV